MEISMASTDSVKILVVGDSGKCILISYNFNNNLINVFCVTLANSTWYKNLRVSTTFTLNYNILHNIRLKITIKFDKIPWIHNKIDRHLI